MSLCLGIHYLAGYAVATDPASRRRAEWPPHPARVFMALAAAHFETDADPAEAEALRWLEGAGEPVLYATEADERPAVETFVPVNDKPTGSGMLQSVTGLTRSRQPRMFPRVWPHDERVYLLWPDADASLAGHRAALEQLCTKVTRIGHSSSLVQMWVDDDISAADGPHLRWEPDDLEADVRLRVPSGGLLGRLAADFDRERRPSVGTWRGYRRPREVDPEVPGSIWDPHLIVRRLEPTEENAHRRLDLVATLQVMTAMQRAVLSRAAEPVPEFISGHRAGGSPTDRPHLAYLPLAFVDQEHATGHLLGLAVAVPAGLERAERYAALAAVGEVEELHIGRLGAWRLVTDDQSRRNLRSETWTGGPAGSKHWSTVTPIVFDRHAKAKGREQREKELVAMVRQCCTRIGLPEPHVIIRPVSEHLGVPAAHEFPRLRRKDGSERRHVHASLIFHEKVRGPIALGAGRFRGYGFCRPLRNRRVV